MTVTLTLAAAVAHDDTVTVSYTRPATDDSNRLEDADGNETADFTDQAVDNITNAAATGKPAISGAAEVGETLTAGQGDIADDNGLPATFPDDYSFQWHRVDADGSTNRTAITNATSATYTLTAADEDRKVIVAVSFTDDDGHAETLESDAYPSVDTVTVADTTAPAFDSATVNETALVITFDEALARGREPGERRVHGEGGRHRGHPGRDAEHQRRHGNADPGRCGSARRHGDGELREGRARTTATGWRIPPATRPRTSPTRRWTTSPTPRPRASPPSAARQRWARR